MQASHYARAGMLLITAAVALITGCASTPSSTDTAARRTASLKQIEHIVVIYAENRSFDHRSYWIPGSWHVRMVYTDDNPFHDPSQESNRAGQHQASRR